jgi:hypothetical protein
MLKVSKETGILEIPKGYKWCEDCNALTPHKEERSYFRCMICEDLKLEQEYACPNCNHSPSESDMESPETLEIPIHKEDCEAQKKIWEYEDLVRRIDNEEILPMPPYPEIDCNCLKVTIYPAPWLFAHWNRPSFSMECMNAQEWGGQIRCPICGTIYDYEDSNC